MRILSRAEWNNTDIFLYMPKYDNNNEKNI